MKMANNISTTLTLTADELVKMIEDKFQVTVPEDAMFQMRDHDDEGDMLPYHYLLSPGLTLTWSINEVIEVLDSPPMPASVEAWDKGLEDSSRKTIERIFFDNIGQAADTIARLSEKSGKDDRAELIHDLAEEFGQDLSKHLKGLAIGRMSGLQFIHTVTAYIANRDRNAEIDRNGGLLDD